MFYEEGREAFPDMMYTIERLLYRVGESGGDRIHTHQQ